MLISPAVGSGGAERRPAAATPGEATGEHWSVPRTDQCSSVRPCGWSRGSRPVGAPGGIRTLTVRVLNPLPLPVGIPGRAACEPNVTAMWGRRFRRVVTLGVLAVRVALFRNNKLAESDAPF